MFINLLLTDARELIQSATATKKKRKKKASHAAHRAIFDVVASGAFKYNVCCTGAAQAVARVRPRRSVEADTPAHPEGRPSTTASLSSPDRRDISR